jgi:HlyD family secretion protein
VKAGAWEPDRQQARAEVAQAEASLRQVEVEIERTRVRAPVDATVLEVNVRVGVYAQPNTQLVLLGDLSTLHLRVDVDEESAPLVQRGCRALAFVKGFPRTPIPLEFVRIEPYIRPKRSLTGENNERVDTRVLQVIFRLGRAPLPVYVGQQVDVFMEALPRETLAR